MSVKSKNYQKAVEIGDNTVQVYEAELFLLRQIFEAVKIEMMVNQYRDPDGSLQAQVENRKSALDLIDWLSS